MRKLPRYQGSEAERTYTQLLQERFALGPLPPPRECFRRVRGHDLHLDLHEPAGDPRGRVILIHGAGAHGRVLAPFAAPLVARGFSVCAPDLPGYGITRPAHAITRYDAWIDLVADLADDAAREGPVFLFGLSVGGLTALRAAQRAHAVRGVIASTLVDLRRADTFDRVGRSALLGRLSRKLFRLLPSTFDRVPLRLRWVAPIEKLSADAVTARSLCDDPLIGRSWVRFGFLRSLHFSAEPAPSYDLPCPLLLVHPGADAWTPLALSQPVFDAVKSSKQRVVLSNGSHAPLEQPAYGELSRAVTDFIEANLAVRSGDAAHVSGAGQAP